MTSWSVHVRDGRPVVLVPERFSLGAMSFGPVWLLAHGAWIPAVLLGCAWGAAVVLTPTMLLPVVLVAMTQKKSRLPVVAGPTVKIKPSVSLFSI